MGLESGLRWNTTNIVTYFARVCSRNLVLSDDVDSSIAQKINKAKKIRLSFLVWLDFIIYEYIIIFLTKKYENDEEYQKKVGISISRKSNRKLSLEKSKINPKTFSIKKADI